MDSERHKIVSAARFRINALKLGGQDGDDLTRFGLNDTSLNQLKVSIAIIGIKTDQQIANLPRDCQEGKELATKAKLLAEDWASKTLLTLTMTPRIIGEEVRRKLRI